MPDRQLHVAVVMDPIEDIKPAKDTTLAMMLAAQRRGWRLAYLELRHLWLRDGVAFGRAHPVEVRDDMNDWYARGEGAVTRLGELRTSPAPQIGAPARVETVPKLAYFAVQNSARTSGSRQENRLIVGRLGDSDTLVVSGQIYRGSAPSEEWVAVHDPAAYFGAALRAALAEEGIAVAGGLRQEHGLPESEWELVTVWESDLAQTLEGRPIVKGDLIEVSIMGRKFDLVVQGYQPSGEAATIQNFAQIKLSEKPAKEEIAKGPKVAYEDIGGIGIDEGSAGKAVIPKLTEHQDYLHKNYKDRIVPINFASQIVLGTDTEGNEIKNKAKPFSVSILQDYTTNHKLIYTSTDLEMVSELERMTYTKTTSGELVYKTLTDRGGKKGEDHFTAALWCVTLAYFLKLGNYDFKAARVKLATPHWFLGK